MSSTDKSQATRSARSPESFESQRHRDNAVEILQSYEKLSWLSFQRCESIAQTRHYYRKIVAGFDPKEDHGVFWTEDFTPHPPKEAKKSGSSRKGKERASLGHDVAASGSKSHSVRASANAQAEPATSEQRHMRAEMDLD